MSESARAVVVEAWIVEFAESTNLAFGKPAPDSWKGVRGCPQLAPSRPSALVTTRSATDPKRTSAAIGTPALGNASGHQQTPLQANSFERPSTLALKFDPLRRHSGKICAVQFRWGLAGPLQTDRCSRLQASHGLMQERRARAIPDCGRPASISANCPCKLVGEWRPDKTGIPFARHAFCLSAPMVRSSRPRRFARL